MCRGRYPRRDAAVKPVRVVFAVCASGLAGDAQRAPLDHLIALVREAAATLSCALDAPANAAHLSGAAGA